MSTRLVSDRPAPRPPKVFRFPAFSRARLDNGMQVIACHLPGRTLASAALAIEAGYAYERDGQHGVALLAARALTQGAGPYDATGFVDASERLGADVGVGADWDGFTIGARAPVDRMPQTLALVAEAALRPAFPAEEVERLRSERINDIAQQMANPSTRAMLALAPASYAPGSAYSRPGGGTVDSVAALERDDLAAYYAGHASPHTSTLIVAGDLSGVDVLGEARRLFGDWEPLAVPDEPVAPLDGVSATNITIVHRPGSVQSNIAMGHIGLERTSPDFYASRLVVEVLGGSFSSRINQKLREEKGYTYGSRASVDYRRMAGPFTSMAPVQTDVTAPAVVDMLAEISRMHAEGPTAQELSETCDYLIGVFPLRFETPDAIAGGIGSLVVYGHDDDWFDTYAERLRAVTVDHAAAAARRLLRPDRIAIVVVGDADVVAGPLEATGIGPVTVQTDAV